MNFCKICGLDAVVSVVSKSAKLYHRCTKCDYIFLDEKFILDAQSEKKHYDNHHNTLESVGYVMMFEKLIDEFIAPLDHIKTALDFGCGEGRVLSILLQKKGIVCDNYDVFYHPKKIYKDKKYDLIISTEVFEHLCDPMNVLEELVSHLSSGGYLLLMSSFHPKDDEKFLKWYYIQDTTHIGFFSMQTFSFMAQKVGVKILKNNEKNIVLFQSSNVL